MEKKSIIVVVIIVLLIVIIGVTIFFANKPNTITNSESGLNSISDEKDTIGPKDPSEDIPDTNTLNYIFTE